MGEKWLAVLGLVACLGVWAGMALGPVRRHRLLAWWRGTLQLARMGLRKPGQTRQAREQASDAIERARRGGKVDREGNVYRPDAFQHKPGRHDKLH